MHPTINPFGYIFIGLVAIIVLDQVYYHWLGGKKHATAMQFKDLIPSKETIQTLVKELKQAPYEEKAHEEQQRADDIANDNAYVLPPKYFTISISKKIIIIMIILFVACNFFVESYAHIKKLAERCETIFDLQAMFVQELGLFGIYVLCVLFIFIQHISYFVYRNQPHHKIKAHWFNEKIVYKHKSNLDKPTFANDYLPVAFPLVLLMLWTSLPDVRSDLQKLNVNSANQYYHQQCLEKQQEIKEQNSVK